MPPVTKDFIAYEAGSVSNVCVLGGQGAIGQETHEFGVVLKKRPSF